MILNTLFRNNWYINIPFVEGEIYAWGSNVHGQLGIGKTTQREINPVLIESLTGIPIALIACGGNHSFAVSKSGAVYGWGMQIETLI